MSLEITILPTLNAALNAIVMVLLLRGYWHIRHGRREAHRRAMQAAFAGSVIFLVSYLTYHFAAGSVRFPGGGWARRIYLGILLTHTVLAALVPILAVTTLVLGLRGSFERHRRIARWTLPIWLYVAVTGIVVYVMLYRMTWS
jgi:uncharacterized membrane protein YozB (DUF420 family)